MKKIKVLISGVGGDVAQGVIKALKKSSLNLALYKICAYRNSSWLYMDNLSFLAPMAADEDYVPFLIRFMKKYNINVFFPCIDSEIVKISENKRRIEDETGSLVFVDDFDKVSICDDKYKTYEFLKSNNFKCPETIIPKNLDDIKWLIEKVGYPLIAKKRISRGSHHVQVINTFSESRLFIGDTNYILQEFLRSESDEFTSGIYLGDDKEVKGICTFRREMKSGSTYRGERIVDKALEKPLVNIARKLDMKYLNIQSRKKDNYLCPFEFNGRFSGTTGIISRIFNAPEMFIREKILKQEVKRIKNSKKFLVMRYYEEIYADLKNVQTLLKRSKNI